MDVILGFSNSSQWISRLCPAGSFCPGKRIFSNKTIFNSNRKNYRQSLEIKNFHFSIASREKQINMIIVKKGLFISYPPPCNFFSISEALPSVDTRPKKNQQLFQLKGTRRPLSRKMNDGLFIPLIPSGKPEKFRILHRFPRGCSRWFFPPYFILLLFWENQKIPAEFSS